MFAAVSAHIVNAQTEYRPEFKDYTNSDGQTLVNIDNPETRQQQYHTVDFDRSKWLTCVCSFYAHDTRDVAFKQLIWNPIN